MWIVKFINSIIIEVDKGKDVFHALFSIHRTSQLTIQMYITTSVIFICTFDIKIIIVIINLVISPIPCMGHA